jgi:hypothetical protein
MTAARSPVVVSFPQPARLLSMNDRHHWRVRARLVGAWRHAAHMAAVEQMPPGRSRRRLPPSLVRCHFDVPTRRARDPHNLFATVKAIVDGLVDAGLWPDDTSEWVTTVEPMLRPAPGVVRAGGRLMVTVEITAREQVGL